MQDMVLGEQQAESVWGLPPMHTAIAPPYCHHTCVCPLNPAFLLLIPLPMSSVQQTQVLQGILSFHLKTFADPLRHVMSTRTAPGRGLIQAETPESTQLPEGHSSPYHLTVACMRVLSLRRSVQTACVLQMKARADSTAFRYSQV